jgi:hypothetical protein
VPRQKKIKTGKDLELIRGSWYVWARNYRQLVKNFDQHERDEIEILSKMIPPCKITAYGGPPHNWPPDLAFMLARQYKIKDVEWLNPWFATEEGWQEYKTAFENLPEVVNLYTTPCVQNGGVVQVIHRIDEIVPESRKIG